MQETWYAFRQTKEQEVVLYRVYGQSPVVTIPEKIARNRVTELAAYCFAVRTIPDDCLIASNDQLKSRQELTDALQQGRIREITGEYVHEVSLPDGMQTIGKLAFYRCNKLSKLVVGKKLCDMGSDAFMNCDRFSCVVVRGSIFEQNGLKPLLTQRQQDMKVVFQPHDHTEAVLWYAEYSEYYDEIGPAHIFELCIDGDGFRQRQCFTSGKVDIAKYDEVFTLASQREKKEMLSDIALMRLYYPVGLSAKAKKDYEVYLIKEAVYIGRKYTKERNLELLEYLAKNEYLTESDLMQCMQDAIQDHWTEGAGALLRLKNEITQKEEQTDGADQKDEYTFDDLW